MNQRCFTQKPLDFTSQALHFGKLICAPNSCRQYEKFPVRLSVWYDIAYHTSELFISDHFTSWDR